MAGVVAYGTYVTHNLGGQPGRCVSFVGIVGRERGDPR